jgi:hypothetical protein
LSFAPVTIKSGTERVNSGTFLLGLSFYITWFTDFFQEKGQLGGRSMVLLGTIGGQNKNKIEYFQVGNEEKIKSYI